MLIGKETKENDQKRRHILFHRSVRWVAGMLLALSLEPIHCGVPTMHAEAAEVAPALIDAEGKSRPGFPICSVASAAIKRSIMEQRAKGYNIQVVFSREERSIHLDATVGDKCGRQGCQTCFARDQWSMVISFANHDRVFVGAGRSYDGTGRCIPMWWSGRGIGMMLMMLLFWGLVIAGLVLAIRWLLDQGRHTGQ